MIQLSLEGEQADPILLLHVAASKGKAEHVRLALDRGADPNGVLDGQTALHAAVTVSNGLVLPALIAAGADVNALNDAGRAPIQCTATSTIAMALFACGADVSADDAFYRDKLQAIGRMKVAIRCGVPEWIERAIECETDVDLISAGRAAVVAPAIQESLLTIRDADWEIVLNSERFTEDSLRRALELGGNPNVMFQGLRPLHLAVEHHSINSCRTLIRAGAVPDAVDVDGFAPIRCTNSLMKARALIAFGSSPEGCMPGPIFDELSGLSRIQAACQLAESGSRDERYIIDVLLSPADENELLDRRKMVDLVLRKDPNRSGADFMRSWLAREVARDALQGIAFGTSRMGLS